MYRISTQKLLKWKESKHRKPLIIEGARQVGKTWLMKEFGKLYFADTVYFVYAIVSRFGSGKESLLFRAATLFGRASHIQIAASHYRRFGFVIYKSVGKRTRGYAHAFHTIESVYRRSDSPCR